MKRLLQEPLLHFLLLGGMIFTVYHFLAQREGREPGEIVVTAGQVSSLAVAFSRTWQRPPSPSEMETLIQDYIREEVYCREAMAMKLDQDDIVIRRRLRQKLEFVSDDLMAPADPVEADLRAYLLAHPEKFRLEPQLSFRQIYLNLPRHGDRLSADAAQLLTKLDQMAPDADVSAFGDSTMLEGEYRSISVPETARQFGEAFAVKLSGLTPGKWQGPFESNYGAHLVLVRGVRTERVPPLTEIRDKVQREWANTQRVQANEQFYQKLLQRYIVTVEKPVGLDTSKTVATAP